MAGEERGPAASRPDGADGLNSGAKRRRHLG